MRTPVPHPPLRTLRRATLRAGLGLAAVVALPAARAQGLRLAVAQIVDLSPAQQDISRDFLVGARVAWQVFNRAGGLKGRAVEHLALETDGGASGVRAALDQARQLPTCLALSGTVSAPVAATVDTLLQGPGPDIAHIAPWLHDAPPEDRDSHPIFATRQAQIAHALKSLAGVGMRELGVVFGTEADEQRQLSAVRAMAGTLGLKLVVYAAQGDTQQLARRLGADTPAVLLFVGGTPELARFALGLERQARQRYVVALGDVNPLTLQQLGAARQTPLIVTQPVPLISASLPLVRAYREALGRLYDEPASPHGLAGYIAARYTQEMLTGLDGTPTRTAVREALRRRPRVDLGGLTVGPPGRVPAYVTQSMLTPDGRLIG